MGRWRRAFGLEEKEEVVVLADEKEDIEVLIEPDGDQKMTGHAEQHSALTRIQKDNVVKFAETEKDITELGKEVDRNTGDIDDIADYLGGIYFEVSLGKERWVFDTQAVPREGNFTAFSYNFDIYNTEFWINEIAAGTAETGFDKARPGDKMNIHSFSNPTTSYGDYVITSIVLDKNAVWIVTGDFVEGVGRLTAGQSYEIEIIHVTKQFNDDGVGGPIEHEYPYVKSNADTKIKPTADNRFITLINERPKEDDGSYADEAFGLEVDIDEGNTWKNQFSVGNRHGFALKVMGGGGRNTWFGGKLTQKGDSVENLDDRDYIIRQNLTEATDELATKIDLEELQVEVDALATTRDAGRWTVADSAGVRPGEVHFASSSMSTSDNLITVNDTDLDGKVHGWSDLEAGDFLEVVQETDSVTKSVGSYGLFKITTDNGGTGIRSMELALDQGSGDLAAGSNVFIKVFHANNDLDLAELDKRYALKNHTHTGGSGSFISVAHGKETSFATNENWNNNVYHFAYSKSSNGGFYYGGNVQNTGKVEFKNGTGLYGKPGQSGVLIASDTGSFKQPFLVIQVFYTVQYSQTNTGGTNVQRFEGVPIYSRSTVDWTNVSKPLTWTWRGDKR